MKPDQIFGFENAGWPALLIDKTGVILRTNQVAIETFGPEILGGAKLSAIWSHENPSTAADFLMRWERHPAASNLVKFNVRGVNVSYTTVICGLKQEGDPLYVLQLFPDIGSGLGTAGGPPAEGTMQQQKLEVAIKLARSVALDFKNALSGVLGHSSLLLMQSEPDHPWRKALEEIEKAVARGADAAASLGSFAKQERQPQAHAMSNLNVALEKATEGLKTAAGERAVEWEFHLERKLFGARFDETKVQQAITKVLENAIESMARGGVVRISTRNVVLSQATQDRTAKLPAGTYVCAEIADNGAGIDEAILPRVFEPFFSTKGSAKHRGLGLPWVYGVITNLRGGVAISSQPGTSTSVRIYLPAENQYVTEPHGDTSQLRGTETILLVDDEEIILSMGEAVLTSFGYKVITAASGKKAMAVFQKPGWKVDLLVTDLIMPGMSGTELVMEIHKFAAGMPVIMMSGALPGSDASSKTYLAKPFTSIDLLRKVRGVLPGTQPSP